MCSTILLNTGGIHQHSSNAYNTQGSKQIPTNPITEKPAITIPTLKPGIKNAVEPDGSAYLMQLIGQLVGSAIYNRQVANDAYEFGDNYGVYDPYEWPNYEYPAQNDFGNAYLETPQYFNYYGAPSSLPYPYAIL